MRIGPRTNLSIDRLQADHLNRVQPSTSRQNTITAGSPITGPSTRVNDMVKRVGSIYYRLDTSHLRNHNIITRGG